MKITKNSLNILQKINEIIDNKTFHHHYHILYDIANSYPNTKQLIYLEIGCYAGGSSGLMLQRKNTNVISIDVGYPIPKEIACSNINKLNIHGNSFEYIHGSSKDNDVISYVTTKYPKIDILFIDGDHSFHGVQNDFQNYSPLINSGGYLIFDDYLDSTHSPDVRKFVDSIAPKISDEYLIIGNIDNRFDARPAHFESNNLFIMKKI